MSRSTDAGHFFQTSSALSESDRKAAKSKNNLGNPVKLSSKLLAVIPDPRSDNAVLVAESAGCIRRVVLDQSDNSKSSETYTGPEAPLTSLTISPDRTILFAGCWDKAIWSWDFGSRTLKQKYLGHADFVKCVTTARIPPSITESSASTSSQDILISGSADGSIIIWNISSGAKLHVLKPGSRGVLDLAIYPIPLDDTENVNGIDLFTAHSDKSIHHFHITATSATQLSSTTTSSTSQVNLTTAHETSVDSLFFRDLSSNELELWTASADKTSKGFSYIPTTATTNTDCASGSWTLDTTLQHPDFVRAAVVLNNRVITACRDENVRVWDASTGTNVAVLAGHYEEVTGLCIISGNRVVSVSIDGTVRTWSVDSKGLEEAKRAEDEWISGAANEKKGENGGVELTAEEEAELAELMDEDD